MANSRETHGHVGGGDEGRRAGLREAVALDDGAAHADFEEVLHVARQRGAAGHDQAHTAAEALLDLAEYQLVEKRRCLRMSDLRMRSREYMSCTCPRDR